VQRVPGGDRQAHLEIVAVDQRRGSAEVRLHDHAAVFLQVAAEVVRGHDIGTAGERDRAGVRRGRCGGVIGHHKRGGGQSGGQSKLRNELHEISFFYRS